MSVRPDVFPKVFALLRHHSRGYYWHIFKASIHSEWVEVEAPDESFHSSLELTNIEDMPQQNLSQILHIPTFRFGRGELCPIYFWFTSISLTVAGRDIPVLDFQYKAWLPTSSYRIPVENIREVQARIKYCYRIFQRYGENRLVSRFEELPLRSPTPPRARSSSPESVSSIASETSTLSLLHTGFHQGHLENPVVTTKPLHLPDPVGELLLNQAWASNDACSITAVPFKEIHSLSVTSCFHIFDTEALNHWCQTEQICPLCRTPITNTINKSR